VTGFFYWPMGPNGLEMLDGSPSLKERPCPSPRNQVDGLCKRACINAFCFAIYPQNFTFFKTLATNTKGKDWIFSLKWSKSNRILFWGRLSPHLCQLAAVLRVPWNNVGNLVKSVWVSLGLLVTMAPSRNWLKHIGVQGFF